MLFFSVTHLQVKSILDDVLEKLPEQYNMSDITSKTAERSPYILVCFQECERMNMLTCEIRRSLKELDLGLKVSSNLVLTLSELYFMWLNVPPPPWWFIVMQHINISEG